MRLALTDLDRYDLLSDISELSDAQVKQIVARSTEVMDGMPKGAKDPRRAIGLGLRRRRAGHQVLSLPDGGPLRRITLRITLPDLPLYVDFISMSRHDLKVGQNRPGP